MNRNAAQKKGDFLVIVGHRSGSPLARQGRFFHLRNQMTTVLTRRQRFMPKAGSGFDDA